MMNPYKKKPNYFKVILSSIIHCWHVHPPLFIGLILTASFLCAVQVGEIFALRHLFDAVTEHINGTVQLEQVITAAIPMAALLIAFPIVNTLAWLAQGYFWRRGSGYLMAQYHKLVQRIPLIDFEKSETFNRMKKAQLGSEGAPSVARTIVELTFYFVPYVAFTSIFLVSVKPILLIVLFILLGSVLLSQILRAGIMRQFTEQNVGLQRQTEYYECCITGKEYVKETRTLGATDHFFGLLLDSIKRYNVASIKSERKAAIIEVFLRFANGLGYGSILGLLVYYVFEGSVSVGAFASVFYSLERINDLLGTLVDYVGEMLQDIGTASFTYDFLSMPTEEGSHKELDKNVDIRIEGASFAYPEGPRVLNDITLTIKQGETLAIVGENGAGKTTLTKMIIGLYAPSSGVVKYGEKNIGNYISSSRFKGISSVFQSFMRYKLTARENIEISDVTSHADVAWAATEAGTRFCHLPDGLDTTVSREFDGTELSGGQWQRVAIARGLYRKNDIIVLDEPTAAIDPIEESNIFALFQASAKGKTAILVTHRLGSAKIADRILLLEDGCICEYGTHEALMAQQGKYARMFHEQSGWYQR